MKRYLHDIVIAFEAIMANKLKSLLTALGIIFGVAAVITMLAIGNGGKQEILDLIKMVGVNNIIIRPIIENEEDSDESDEQMLQKFSRGLTINDVNAINEVLPTIKEISPEVSFDTYVIQNGKRKSARLVGVSPVYFDLFKLELFEGVFFSEYQNTHGSKVCIIGEGIRAKLFNQVNPIGQYIKCGKVWLKVIGVIQKRHFDDQKNTDELWMTSSNESIYIPIHTMILRYVNRSLITAIKIRDKGDEKEVTAPVNYHQLDKVVVQVDKTENLMPSVEIIKRILLRRHSGVQDFEITVPELLLKQQQKTKDILNYILVAIAGISLLVGGIGIMNIMLASVMERIKEIGTRLAIGAKKNDIIVQFIAESTIISISGGLFGVLLGVVMAKLVTHFMGSLTIITIQSILVAFGISVAVGIIFGFMPAKRAAGKDPVESLRHE